MTTVSFGEQAGVKDGDNAPVGAGAHQPTHTLAQGEYGAGHLVIGEGIASLGADAVDARHNNRVAWHFKR